jgi:hypothetical protein
MFPTAASARPTAAARTARTRRGAAAAAVVLVVLAGRAHAGMPYAPAQPGAVSLGVTCPAPQGAGQTMVSTGQPGNGGIANAMLCRDAEPADAEGAASPDATDRTPATAVPEPAPWLAMLGGLVLLTARHARR